MNTVDKRKILAAQQYALNTCQDDMKQLERVKNAYIKGFETANETFQYTLEDMIECFNVAKSNGQAFEDYLTTIKK